ncbi:MAG TPA: hypothetical protein VNZ22_11915, partial [Bacillota bacterium]|nr:hypothetical protein [Bacillota bacterium]
FSGPWSYDRSGRVIGYFVERIQVPNSTNEILNSIGFVAHVVPGRRLVLTATTPNGRVTYNGVPLSSNLTDLSGSWYAIRRQGSSSQVEFFEVTPSLPPYLYSVTGQGAGYSYSGVAMVSAWKRFGMAVDVTNDGTTNSYTRSVLGPFYSKRGLAATAGMEEPKTRILFNAIKN